MASTAESDCSDGGRRRRRSSSQFLRYPGWFWSTGIREDLKRTAASTSKSSSSGLRRAGFGRGKTPARSATIVVVSFARKSVEDGKIGLEQEVEEKLATCM
ncbi:unnamed protein product [Nippostrongylus brasiliensis]|uniref:Uncharacterized protein n=1 Tax=Nippostrongylus brasiliensis TaxID=27835 RepID=A0A0N4Y913_NIPBR|nr:unnamed protein product [Nippostrongylus brasiliensis]